MKRNMHKNPVLGDIIQLGACGECTIYTMRGWVRCENQKEVDAEMKDINNFLDKNK